jgi:hypothetical protein
VRSLHGHLCVFQWLLAASIVAMVVVVLSAGRCITPPPEDPAVPVPAPNCESHCPSRRALAAGGSRGRESLPTDVTSQASFQCRNFIVG